MYYHRITHSGHFANVGIFRDLEEYIICEDLFLHIPYLRDPKKLEGGLCLSQIMENQGFEKVLLAAKEKFNCNMVLHFINKTEDGVEGFGFGLPSSNIFHHIALLNELPLLRHFITCFKKEFPQLPAAFTETQTDLATLIGPAFYKPPQITLTQPSSRNAFLKKMGVRMEVPLSSRDIEVVQRLHKGYSASQMADELHLSKRTIEHRLEKVKDKLSCSSKTELIQTTKTLESLGYL